ncbi:hypothetical protein [Williamsia sp.]|uniref:hypothetical protein n=1 Tax=Williamsia sp. TaxID=1872085 RepID=UPI0025D8A68C|nr:hypothetical protein [Williamsia sp.]
MNYIDDVPAGVHGRLSEHGLGDTVTMAHTGYRDPSGAPVHRDDIRLQDGTGPTNRTPFDTEQSIGAKRRADADDGPEPPRKSARLAARETAQEPDSRPGGDRSRDDSTAQNRPNDPEQTGPSRDREPADGTSDEDAGPSRDIDRGADSGSTDADSGPSRDRATPDPTSDDFAQTRVDDSARAVEENQRLGDDRYLQSEIDTARARGRLDPADVTYSHHTEGITNPVLAQVPFDRLAAGTHTTREVTIQEFRRLIPAPEDNGPHFGRRGGANRVAIDSPVLDPNTRYVVRGHGTMYTRDDGTVELITYAPRGTSQNPLAQHRWTNTVVITDAAFFHRDTNGALTVYHDDAHNLPAAQQHRNDNAQTITTTHVLDQAVIDHLNEHRDPSTPEITRSDFNAGHPYRNQLGAPSEPYVYSMEYAGTNQVQQGDAPGAGYATEDILSRALGEPSTGRRGIWARTEIMRAGEVVPDSYIVEISLDGGRNVHRFEFRNTRSRS